MSRNMKERWLLNNEIEVETKSIKNEDQTLQQALYIFQLVHYNNIIAILDYINYHLQQQLTFGFSSSTIAHYQFYGHPRHQIFYLFHDKLTPIKRGMSEITIYLDLIKSYLYLLFNI